MREDVFTPAAFGEKPTTIAILLQGKAAAPPTGIPAWADIFGESLQGRRHGVTAWQNVHVARVPLPPQTADYL